MSSNVLGMINIAWAGGSPPPSWSRELSAAEVVLHRRDKADCVARVYFRDALPEAQPEAAAELPWLWIGRGELSPRALQAAVLRGAYDAFSRDQKGASERLLRRLQELSVPVDKPPLAPEFVTQSASGRELLAAVFRAARTSQPVLLTGETGTGKEVIARLLHRWSPRREHSFVPINCAAIPNELMEAELFGYSRGAFSGAVQRYDGQLMAAQHGTVFLDEVDDTPLSVQTKLLRVLEDHVVSRLGENEWHRVDFRLIAATNRDLRPLLEKGVFGADLYQRLAIVSLELPPLRARLDDLPLLVEHFLARFFEEEPSAKSRARVSRVTPEAMAVLRRYPFPGNVRELRNVIFHSLVGKRGGEELLLSDLPRRIVRGEPLIPGELGAGSAASPSGMLNAGAIERGVSEGGMNLRATVNELERLALRAALLQAGGNASEAARLLGEVGHGKARDPGGTVRAMMRRLRVRNPRGAARSVRERR